MIGISFFQGLLPLNPDEHADVVANWPALPTADFPLFLAEPLDWNPDRVADAVGRACVYRPRPDRGHCGARVILSPPRRPHRTAEELGPPRQPH
ncbi:hypothetical protein [Streptomyces sp. NBC_01500]|uniref:hypothetical protein n=1 Tax=unclassified Streptomyces TaxID=2593676 RepID=UPI00225BDC14|nr:hypothetical protein [Streptomyces sp. NBC_01500]MCX4553476.1 hypothetical protein [Streptomyces sp. NBC_01500]